MTDQTEKHCERTPADYRLIMARLEREMVRGNVNQKVLAYLKRWRTERGLTLVASSHNMDDLAFLVERICVLQRGCLVTDGPARDVFAQVSAMRRLGLDVPGPAAAIDALIEAGLPVPRGALSIHETAAAIETLWAQGDTDGRL